MEQTETRPPRWNVTRSLRALAAPVALTIALGTARGAAAQDAGIMLGAAAPRAAVETLDGRTVNLGDYIGKRPVVLEFWATWCPLCKQLEAPLAAARQKHGDHVTFIAVGVRDNQTPDRQKKYARSKHIGGTLVFDRGGQAVAAYKVPHTSYLVAINAKGSVVYTGVGGNQDVEAAVSRALMMDAAMPNAMAPGAMDHGAMKPESAMKPEGAMDHGAMKPEGAMDHGAMKPESAMKPNGGGKP